MKPLSEALNFEAPEVILRFKRLKNCSLETSEENFTQIKKWLWACAKRFADEEEGLIVPKQLIITSEIQFIDEVWHCFLLFTQEYQFFCEHYLGRFIHHIPLTSEEIDSFASLRKENPKAALEQRKNELMPQLTYLYDLLGEETLRRWYLPVGF